jgi:amino-acid N-acetyltransferase
MNALRSGGRLLLPSGRRWMHNFDPQHVRLETFVPEAAASTKKFVDMFRDMAPYIAVHANKTFVIHLSSSIFLPDDDEQGLDGADSRSELSERNLMTRLSNSKRLSAFISDLALLHTLGVRLVLVPGVQKMMEKRLEAKGIPSIFEKGVRVTDDDAMEAAVVSAGRVRFVIEGLLQRGVRNSPVPRMQVKQNQMNVASGSLVTARPVGVVDGVDYLSTGAPRKLNVDKVKSMLDAGDIVLLPNIGLSPSGEVFNCDSKEIAEHAASQLGAGKLIYFTEGQRLVDETTGMAIHHLYLPDAQQLMASLQQSQDEEDAAAGGKRAPGMTRDLVSVLAHAVRACTRGVQRTHLVSHRTDGSLLAEMFTRDGNGLLISGDVYEGIRSAVVKDVEGIHGLVRPLEEQGFLVTRSTTQLERELDHFTVIERDGSIIACCSLIPYEDGSAELSCVVVAPEVRKSGRGDALLGYMTRKAITMGYSSMFVLSTVTMHWFVERGFVPSNVECLPPSKREKYNADRRSKVFVKQLGTERAVDEEELFALR